MAVLQLRPATLGTMTILWDSCGAPDAVSCMKGSRTRTRAGDSESSGYSSGRSDVDALDSSYDGWTSKSVAPSAKWPSLSIHSMFNIWSPSVEDEGFLDEIAPKHREEPHWKVDLEVVKRMETWGAFLFWESVPTPQEAEELLQREIDEATKRAEAKAKEKRYSSRKKFQRRRYQKC